MQPNGFYNPSINHQQNQPMVPHQANYNNWYNVQQFSNNGMNNYYNSTPIAYQLPKYNNGFLMPTNVPYIPPYNNTYNANFSNNGYIPQSMQPAFQPTLSYSYNNVILPNQNVNVNNATNFNRQMTSNTTTCYQGNQFTHNMPSKVNPVNINYEPQVSGSNNQNVNNAINFNRQMTSNTTTCYQGNQFTHNMHSKVNPVNINYEPQVSGSNNQNVNNATNFNRQMTSNTTTCYQGNQFTHNMPSKVNPVNINYEPQVSGSNNQNVNNATNFNRQMTSNTTTCYQGNQFTHNMPSKVNPVNINYEPQVSGSNNQNVNNATNFNMQMTSNTTTCYQGKQFTHNMPSKVNPVNINYEPQVSGSNNQNVNNATNFNRQMTSNTTTCYQGNQFTHNMPSKVNPVNINYEPQVSGSNNQNVNNATNFNMQMTSNTTTCYQGKQFTHNMPSKVNPVNINYEPQVSGSNNQNVNNATNFNRQMTSNTTTCYQGKQFTHNMPSKVNPVNINYEPQVSGSNNQNVSNSKKDNKWFNSRSTFVNNTSTNLAPNFSMVPNTHQTNSKQNCSMNNQSINTRNPKTISKIFSRTTKPFGTEKISEKLSIHQIIAKERKKYYHSSESDFYKKKLERSIFMPLEICNEFERVLGKRAKHVNVSKPVYNKDHKRNFKVYKCKCSKIKKYDNSDSFSLSDEDSDCENDKLKELALKCAHPDRLHPDIWYNELGELNDGPVCKCSPSSQNLGILHNIYVGEVPFESCLPNTNNADKLYHYRITITPLTNYLHKYPTIIKHNHHNYTFEGFSLLSHYPLPTMPTCTFTRFNTHYTIIYIEEKIPDNFIIQELTLFYDFFFKDILELVDFDFHAIRNKDGCPQFHFIPRFVRDLSNNNKELLSMSNVLKYLLNSNKLLFEENSLPALKKMSSYEWQGIIDEYKDMIITNPETKPSSIRVDQLDRENKEDTIDKKDKLYPVVVHFGLKPAQIWYAGNKEFKKYSKDYLRIKHLLDNKINPSPEDEKELEIIERALQEMRSNDKMKRAVTTVFSSKGFYKTGLMCDIAQHAMLLPILVSHFKFYKSLEYLEKSIGYKFKDKNLLKLALTHSSYRENFGTNSDHIKNTLTNCGIQQPEYGDRENCMYKRSRGINVLINTIPRFGEMEEMETNSKNNERLEFLGDAIIEFITTIHLFSIFPDLEEGGLATYRSALVENRHLTCLAKKINLEDYMLYAHGADSCHCFEQVKVLANCFEAVIGAIFLDGGIKAADYVFGEILYDDSPEHLQVWASYPKHPLQQQNPNGDRECIKISPFLKKLTKFEDSIGVKFNHIRLLAKAFTHKSVGFTNLTLGSNQRLEFLGDSVLQFITSDYLYNCYPEHHEGHLSLLRSSLVKNQTQSDLCNDLDMVSYALRSNQVPEFQIKDKADLVEAFIGALFLDKGLRYCREFCNVCFFPRLPNSIEKPNCHDSKSKLQTYFQNLQPFHVRNPVIPIYKTIEITGPGHCLKHTVGVYFKGVRISTGNGQSKHKAEMNAATIGLEVCKDLFPQLNYQRNAIPRSSHHQSMNGNRNYMIIRQMLETQSSINDTSLSKLEKERNELKYKLLTVLCSDNDFIEENTEDKNKKRNKEEVDEPVRKKLKGKPKT